MGVYTICSAGNLHYKHTRCTCTDLTNPGHNTVYMYRSDQSWALCSTCTDLTNSGHYTVHARFCPALNILQRHCTCWQRVTAGYTQHVVRAKLATLCKKKACIACSKGKRRSVAVLELHVLFPPHACHTHIHTHIHTSTLVLDHKHTHMHTHAHLVLHRSLLTC